MAAAADAKAAATAAENSAKKSAAKVERSATEVVAKAQKSAKKSGAKVETSAKEAAAKAQKSAKNSGAKVETSAKEAVAKAQKSAKKSAAKVETSAKEAGTEAQKSAKKSAAKVETSAKEAVAKAQKSAKKSAAKAETPTRKAAANAGTKAEEIAAKTVQTVKEAAAKTEDKTRIIAAKAEIATKKAVEKATNKKASDTPSESESLEKKDSTVVHLKTTLAERHEWDVFTPPPVDSLKGHFIPEVFHRYKRRRKISLEVQHIHLPPSESKEGQPNFYEEVVVRILIPNNSEEETASKKRGRQSIKNIKKRMNLPEISSGSSTATGKSGMVNPRDSIKLNSASGDDMSVISGMGFEMDEKDYFDANGHKSNDWKPKYIIPLDGVVVNKVDGHKCYTTTILAGVKHARKLLFDSYEAASEFSELIAMYKAEQKERTDRKLKVALGGLDVNQDDKVTLLIEIVSGWDLPAADLTTSDPLVKVFLNGEVVHKTKHIPNTLDPIWTLKTGSLFLLETTVKDLFMSPQGVMFQVFDYDTLGGNDSLGAAIVNPKVLFDATGEERMELKLQQAPGQKMEAAGGIAIRCRHATDYDKRFMAKLEEEGNKEVADASEAEAKAESMAGGKSDLATLATKYVKKVDGIEKIRVRPCPDPKRKKLTEWMTEDEIQNETMLDSNHWFDVGSGKLGRLFVEVLGCDDLPNLDKGVVSKNKTDAFVACIFEDGLINTDIIDDCLSPRWLPWSKRAFIYHIMHTSSQLFLGVFDFDAGFGNDHDLIGRVAVDISNLRKDTTYVMKFDIFPTTAMTKREAQGNITIRLRLEVDDDRKFVMGNLAPPPDVYVNVKNSKDFNVARQTLYGTYDMDSYNMKTINAYVEELMAYKNLIYHVGDALRALLLWRGTFSVLLGRNLKIPIHSFAVWISAIIIVERPSYAPSFFFASISWLLLAVMSWRAQNPDAWLHSKTFRELLEALVIGKTVTSGPDDIPPNYNKEQAEAFRKAWDDRIARAERLATKQAEEAKKLEDERLKELADVGDAEEIGTKAGGISIDPMKRILFPIQQYLAILCKFVRILRNIVYWEESYFAFWLTLGCFALSIVFAFFPWVFLLRWTARIVVWIFLGPVMKVVDIFYYSKIKPLSEEEEIQKILDSRAQTREANFEAVKEVRIQKENNMKLREIKKFMFGKYITHIPILKQDRHKDKPLPESYAVPYKPEPMPLADLAMKEAGYNRTRIGGQHLVGSMIPRIDPTAFTDAPAGNPTARPELLDKDSPGAKVSKDSNVAAYAKIGGIVVAAGAFTWFGVPMLTSYASSGIGYVKGLVGI